MTVLGRTRENQDKMLQETALARPMALDGHAPQARPPRRAVVGITLALWGAVYAILLTRTAIDGRLSLPEATVARAALSLVGCGFCYLIHVALRLAGRRPFAQRAILVAIMAAALAEAYSWVHVYGISFVPSSAPAPNFTTADIIFSVAWWAWVFLSWSALYLALTYSVEVKAQEARWREVEGLAHAAQLRALRYQINPHFLFNTLNSISALILDRRLEDAETMVGRLAGFFRASLAADPLDDIALEGEIALQRAYLDIERVRFPDLTVEIDLPDELADALVPTLILQPLVENAIKYAVAGAQRPATLKIRARERDGRLVLEVSDDGASKAPVHGMGVGLKNVRDRLRQRFGDSASFAAGPTGDGFRVELTLPLRRLTS